MSSAEPQPQSLDAYSVIHDFDVQAYLENRDTNSSFIMVEFGHGPSPVAFQQPVPFKGDRLYVGVEAWLRDPLGRIRESVKVEQAERQDQNIVFIDQCLRRDGRRNTDALALSNPPQRYLGPYIPTTDFPDASVDEVFLGNVIGDPHLAESRFRIQRILNEVSRIVSNNGMIVVRETLTPLSAHRRLSAVALQKAGLQEIGRYVPMDELWSNLEERYGVKSKKKVLSMSFYQFLNKAALAT